MNVVIKIEVVDGHVVLCWKGGLRQMGQEAGHVIVGNSMFGRYLVGVHLIKL